MDRVNQIWNHPLYQNELNKLQLLETDREFCRHTPEHFLDVARLAYIRALEENAPVSKELIYCTALLHDIGRARQYEDGTPHDEAGGCYRRTDLKRAWIFYGRSGSDHCGNTWSQSSDGSDSSWKIALYCGQKLQKLFFL